MITLYINYYTDGNKTRQEEIDTCLRTNELNSQISKIYAIVNSLHYHSTNNKTVFVFKKDRPTFKDFFEFINSVEETKEGTTSIIANSDIYFKDLSLIVDNLKDNECYALGRWEALKNGVEIPFGRNDSQDSWVFKGKIKEVKDCDFELGRQGCDNAIADRLSKAGYVIKNPSVNIRTYHLHNSMVRNYDLKKIVPKPYLLIPPHQINENPIYIERK